MGCGLALAAGFVLAQRADLLAALAAALNRVAAGRFGALAAHSARIDRMTRRLWRARARDARCASCGNSPAGWPGRWRSGWRCISSATRSASAEALAIEALIQAVSSAAFLVPGALGLQEAGFLGLGLLLGLPAEAAAALAIARRMRDLSSSCPACCLGLGGAADRLACASAAAAVTSR